MVNTDASTGTRYLLGTVLNTSSGSTQVSVGSGITIGNNLLTSGGIAVTNSTASTSTSTGSLTVVGGVGIGGSLFTQTLTVGSGITGLFIQKMVGANYVAMYSTNVTPSGTNYTFITDGQSPNFNGTNGVYFNISNSNKVQITNTNVNITPTTGSASTSTGSLTVAGGVGIGGSLWTATTNFSSISGVGFSNSVITSGVWSGIAISTVNGGTGLTSYSVGDILYASSSTVLGKISAGTAGSVLTSAGAGTTPYWALAASTGVTSINGLTSSSQTFSTSISGSGFTIGSTGSTHTFYIGLAGNASTGLISGADQAIFGVKTFASGLAITASTGSTSTSTGALIVTGGAGIAGTLNIGADLGISGLTTLTYTSEKLNTKTSAGSAGTVTHDLSTGSVFYHSSISNNFTANFTNVPTTNDRALGVTLILAQGITPYMSTVLQIDGAAQTIKWVNNTTPTGTASKVDIVGFSLIRTGSAWTVLGQYSTYG